MGIKLSNTKRNKYNECPRRYDFHYNYKYRSKYIGSALFFGVAIDEALNRLLLEKKKILTDSEKSLMSQTTEEVFLKHFTSTFHNGKKIYLRNFELCQYTQADFDSSMLDEDTLSVIGQDLKFCEAHIEWYREEVKKPMPEIAKEDTRIFNMINWYSLRNKGFMILDTYRKEIIPQIYEVYSIQERIKLPNQSGDSIDGIIDFTASFTDDPTTIYVCDNKTASKAYKEKDLSESDQLHLYAYYKEINNIAYIVCEKNIRKKEPRVRINILKGEIDDNFTENLLDTYEETLYSIREKKFNPNFSSGCNFFRKKCEYYDLCHHEIFDNEKLIDMKKEEK